MESRSKTSLKTRFLNKLELRVFGFTYRVINTIDRGAERISQKMISFMKVPLKPKYLIFYYKAFCSESFLIKEVYLPSAPEMIYS